ncbi:hypothetical protein AAF134_03480 [Synechococcus lacustris Tous-12m]
MNDVSRATASGIEDLLLAVELDPSCPETYEAIADQLMVKGYGAEAARWRSWSLLQPSSSNLNQAIAELRELSLGRPSLLDKTEQILDQAQQLYSQGFCSKLRIYLRAWPLLILYQLQFAIEWACLRPSLVIIGGPRAGIAQACCSKRPSRRCGLR